MGIDACICFKVRDGCNEPWLDRPMPNGYTIIRKRRDYPIEATHQVDQDERYFREHYPRGAWPRICHALMLLFRSPDVERVWYCGDDGCDGDEEFTRADLLRLCDFYMRPTAPASDKEE